jgi:transposase
VKTNRRDSVGFATPLHGGELTAVWVPDESHEAMRICPRPAPPQSRPADTSSADQQLHAQAKARIHAVWTMRSLRWLRWQNFDPAPQIALQEMVEAVRLSKERVQRLEAAIGVPAALVLRRSLRPCRGSN